ncbi:beta-lactamase-like protein [Immersiella caudata]|uniref:Beta-lactamase-like protein n=1 Tax=Immersiella caudata TaxID=314043 RepID=A0AA39WBV2_9PEZI|nr:beta-lactamase-like protein [Immersiella caudata]
MHLTTALLLRLGVPTTLARKDFDVPPGAIAKVSIIDSTLRMNRLAASVFLTPALEGFDEFPPSPDWSFLIESSTGRKAVFDLGVPTDENSYSPAVLRQIEDLGFDFTVEKDVADILKEGGVKLTEVESIIWSHYHFDHIGDVATFPPTTEIVVGPGFSNAYLPGYPTNPNSTLMDRYFENRTLREVEFITPLRAGAFSAFDFFGDGSFFLLDTPGHTTGHLGGLARTTTNPDTFIFMGGDLCHHSAQLRPSPEKPIPSDIHFHLHDHNPPAHSRAYQCPGAVTKAELEHLNTKRGRKPDRPFFDPVLVENFTQAVDTIGKTQPADVADNVWFVMAHDSHILGIADFFPKSANQWKKKGWAEKVHWKFLKDLLPAVEVDREAGK